MARTRRSPDGVYATPGAVHQHGGKLPIYICNSCDREVVWCESAKTGRKYLVNISHGHLGQRFYIGANVHKCDGRSLRDPDDISYDAWLEWERMNELLPMDAQVAWAQRRLAAYAEIDRLSETQA